MRKIDWSEGARADVRRIDRKTAMRIFTTIQRFAETGEGDVKDSKVNLASCGYESAIIACASPMRPTMRSEFTPSGTGARFTGEDVGGEELTGRMAIDDKFDQISQQYPARGPVK
jgi:hypothetical protein